MEKDADQRSSTWLPLLAGSNKNISVHSTQGDWIKLQFSDRVSVFDYGALPDPLPGRGRAMARAAKAFFKHLESDGIPTAHLKAEALGLPSLGEDEIALRRAQHPVLDKKITEKFGVKTKPTLRFLPVEVLLRFGAPEGSSLLKRRADIKAGTMWDEPLIELSTKLEDQDRILKAAEAVELLGSDEIYECLCEQAKVVARSLRSFLGNCGFQLWDAKIEMALEESNASGTEKALLPGDFVLVDAITPDEMRLSVCGQKYLAPTNVSQMPIALSKELLRQWLGATPWGASLRYAKEDAAASKEAQGQWRRSLRSPPRLGPWRTRTLCALYEALAESFESQSPEPVQKLLDNPGSPKICVFGGGGREESTRWRLHKEGAECFSQRPAGEMDSIDAFWVSMDADLAAGAVDELQSQGHWCMGPTREASRIEWSKDFGLQIAQQAHISVPRTISAASLCTTKSALDSMGPKEGAEWLAQKSGFKQVPVFKLDGLAAGKGVYLPENWQEAYGLFCQLLAQDSAGSFLLQERLEGWEASAFFAVKTGHAGVKLKALGTAQDFKRRFAHDKGPNTGGMGAYVPHPKIRPSDEELFLKWAQSTAEVLDKKRCPYNGILYLGLFFDEPQKEWKLIEYNARFGDPETQALLMGIDAPEETNKNVRTALRSLLELSLESPEGLGSFRKADTHSLCLSLVHPDYPSSHAKPLELPKNNLIAELAGHTMHFYGSTIELQDSRGVEQLLCLGTTSRTGRLLYLVGQAGSLLEAADKVFEVLRESPIRDQVDWRADILC